MQGAHRRGQKRPELAGLLSGFQVNVPQIDTHVDRERAKTYGVALTDVFETMQAYLGSVYVNDFNRFGRTYQVNVQAEQGVPAAARAIGRLKTRNAHGEMVPLGSLVSVRAGLRPGSGHALQRLPRGRDQRRPGAGLQLRAGAAGDRGAAERAAAERHGVRVDRAGLPAG